MEAFRKHDSESENVVKLRFDEYEKRRRQKLAYVCEALKQGRLEEFTELKKVPKPSVTAGSTSETLRVPLDHDFLTNKKLARQIYEKELHERQKESRTRQQELRMQAREALRKQTEEKAKKAEKVRSEKIHEIEERREQTSIKQMELLRMRES